MGGELRYTISHVYGAAFDNPNLIVACVVDDGKFETGPLATSWRSNKFLNPKRDGAVLPIFHLNGDKIANPTIPARITQDELNNLLIAMAINHILLKETDRKRHISKWLRQWMRYSQRLNLYSMKPEKTEKQLLPAGRVMEVLS